MEMTIPTPMTPMTPTERLDVCDDMTNIILSFLPTDLRRRITRHAYITELRRVMSCGDNVIINSVISNTGGLLPFILDEILKESPIPRYNPRNDGDEELWNLSHPSPPVIENTDGFGDDAIIYGNLLAALVPRKITHVPDDISSSLNHLRECVCGYITRHAMEGYYCDSWGPCIHYDSINIGARTMTPEAIRMIILLRINEWLMENDHECYFNADDAYAAIDMCPEILAYDIDCHTDGAAPLHEILDFTNGHYYSTERVKGIIDDFATRQDRRVAAKVYEALKNVRTRRGFKRAAILLYSIVSGGRLESCPWWE